MPVLLYTTAMSVFRGLRIIKECLKMEFLHFSRAVIKKASALEYKIQRRALRKEDFINYIQYEINLLELIKKRRSRIGYSFKKDEIEYSIVQRIHGLFRRATEKWKDDVQLWLSHVAFCKKWYFRMELMHAEKQRKEKKEFEQAKMDLGEFSYSEEVLNGEMARIIYRNAVQKIKGAEFCLSLLSIAKLFDFTQDLQKEILENLQAEHADDPLTWDYMARRELEMGSLPSPECSSKQMKASEVAQKEERCCAVFEEAVTALPTEAMWKCYVTFCLERLNRKTNSEELRRKRLERTLSVFSGAHESTLLPETLYKQWLHLLLEVGLSEKATEVAAAATKRFSQSVEMWHTRLQVLIKLNSSDVAQCFEEAVRQVKSKGCLPLWTLWVEWSEGANSKEDTQALYQRSLFVIAPADSVTMKEKYLDWAYRDGGYKKAKKVFTSLHESRPFSLEFFRKMIEIEKEQESCKMLNLREYYERALREFGSTDSDLWLDYIKEELNHPQGKPVNCGNIHWRAMKMLEGELVEKFVSKYTLLQTGHL
ncbi:U3 small nucleolar RNA-associated protein 6 homolog isoform X3 [Terrapene carolina triunguis]|uniref:U3 small nucleolar RNA-associated protein 6 homolog isoform X3 n=1 Tax=Terrapene triunguis TaxID=2587831 RepID=UPI000CEF9AAA|nr:U3 small nucleolar RNA-associated protein 6 homolog isoform X3 [Terrapene carolina triunguis]